MRGTALGRDVNLLWDLSSRSCTHLELFLQVRTRCHASGKHHWQVNNRIKCTVLTLYINRVAQITKSEFWHLRFLRIDINLCDTFRPFRSLGNLGMPEVNWFPNAEVCQIAGESWHAWVNSVQSLNAWSDVLYAEACQIAGEILAWTHTSNVRKLNMSLYLIV